MDTLIGLVYFIFFSYLGYRVASDYRWFKGDMLYKDYGPPPKVAKHRRQNNRHVDELDIWLNAINGKAD